MLRFEQSRLGLCRFWRAVDGITFGPSNFLKNALRLISRKVRCRSKCCGKIWYHLDMPHHLYPAPMAPASPVDIARFVLRPRHKWFIHYCKEADDGWFGPYNHIEEAVAGFLSTYPDEIESVFVCQGRRTTKAERDEWAVDFTWQCDTQICIEIPTPHVTKSRY